MDLNRRLGFSTALDKRPGSEGETKYNEKTIFQSTGRDFRQNLNYNRKGSGVRKGGNNRFNFFYFGITIYSKAASTAPITGPAMGTQA
jgi:hypothetical protein